MNPWAWPLVIVCGLILTLSGIAWVLDVRDWWRRRHPSPPPTCEGCGGQADLMLVTGVTYCIGCDTRVRLAGSDNTPAMLLKEGAR